MNENSQAQIIVITGAGSGFGRTTAIELARAGHNVYASMLVADLEGERSASLRSVASEERLDLRPLKLDVREEASCRAAVWQTDGLIEDCAHYSRGEAAEVAPGVQEATGIAPRSFLDFASACAEMFSASIA